ncbi:MAG: type II toxin-antitoxin system HicA family toxin [Spirochaetales bacterium]|nr:type II toxin-antitoxin system HicA family toxin [Spirochaetales bacterium]
MKSFSSSMVIRLLRKRGWYEVACVGDHHLFKHLSIPGRITIPHPKKNLPIGTVRAIFKQAGINEY